MSKEKNLIDLSDDPIIHIFALLPFADSLSMRRTCQRFCQLAQYTFHLYPKKVELTLQKNVEYNPFESLQTLLKTFGRDIKELSFNGLKDEMGSRRFLDLVVDHCCPSKAVGDSSPLELKSLEFKRKISRGLSSLKLMKTVLKRNDPERCSRILQNLETIEFIDCVPEDEMVLHSITENCKQLKRLTLADYHAFNGECLQALANQVEALHLQNLRPLDSTITHYTLDVGSHTKCLILRNLRAEITCSARNLCNLETLQLYKVADGRAPRHRWEPDHSILVQLLPYTGNNLRHLHISNMGSVTEAISKVGNQLVSLSLDIDDEWCYDVYTLLENNPNLRSVKLCHMGDASLYEEVPQRVQNVEELCIWPKTNSKPINLDGVLKLTKLKSFTFFCPRTQTCDLIGQLACIDSLECLGFPINAADFNTNFDEKLTEHFFKLKKLKSLKLALDGSLDQFGFEKIALHFVNLKELKIIHGNVQRQTNNSNEFAQWVSCFLGGMNEGDLLRFREYRSRITKFIKVKTPLKIYQAESHHRRTLSVNSISRKLREESYKEILRLLPLSNDGFFDFFAYEN